MVGLSKFEDKDRRRQRMRNKYAKELASPKYRQQIVPSRKRVDSEDSYYFIDQYYDENDDE